MADQQASGSAALLFMTRWFDGLPDSNIGRFDSKEASAAEEALHAEG